MNFYDGGAGGVSGNLNQVSKGTTLYYGAAYTAGNAPSFDAEDIWYFLGQTIKPVPVTSLATSGISVPSASLGLSVASGFTILVKYLGNQPSFCTKTARETPVFFSLRNNGIPDPQNGSRMTDSGGELITVGRSCDGFVIGRHIAVSEQRGNSVEGNAQNVPNLPTNAATNKGYFEHPWEPRDPNTGSYEYAYFTFTPGGKIRIDLLASDQNGSYDWNAGLVDTGLPVSQTPSGNALTTYPPTAVTAAQFYTPGDLVIGPMAASSYSADDNQTFASGLVGITTFAFPLSAEDIIQYQQKQFNARTTTLLSGMYPCNTGFYLGIGPSWPNLPTYPINTPCGYIKDPQQNGAIPQSPSQLDNPTPGVGYSRDPAVAASNSTSPPPRRLLLAGPESDTTASGGHLNALTVQGNRIVDAVTGQTVQLKGVNLGGWLVTESWMMGELTPDPSKAGQHLNDRFAIERLETHFGVGPGDQLMTDWQNNFITDADFKSIAQQGYNCVRVPFSWRNLQNEQGQWNLDGQGEIDFSRFDWIVQTAAANGLYVVFDLHVWQGQQADYGQITNSQSPDQKHASELWNAFSGHFVGEPAIAGFDLLNEVYPDFNTFDIMYQTIRATDPNRIVVIEAGDWAQMTSGQISRHEKWTNVVWEPHFYTTRYNDGVDTTDLASLEYVEQTLAQNTSLTGAAVPVYVGEFKEEPSTLPTLLQTFNQNGWSWTPWTYKAFNIGDWALLNYGDAPDAALQSNHHLQVNLATNGDSFASIQSEWTTGLQTGSTYSDAALVRATSLGTSSVSSTNPSAYNIGNGSYAVVNSFSRNALETVGGIVSPPGDVFASNHYDGVLNRQWVFTQQPDGSYIIANGQSGLVLDDYQYSRINGSRVVEWSSNGGPNQHWYIRPLGDGSYALVSQASSLNLEIGSAVLGSFAPTTQNQWTGAANQRWYLAPLSASPQGTPPAGFTACGQEGGTCKTPSYQPNIAQSINVAYGAYGSYIIQNQGDGDPCSIGDFSNQDPLPGIGKACFYQTGTQTAIPLLCAIEGGICTLPSYDSGLWTVSYGTPSSFYTRRVLGNAISCNRSSFGGDPAPGQAKTCALHDVAVDPNHAVAPYVSALCAFEGGTCSFHGWQGVAYIRGGLTTVASFNSAVTCTGTNFGVTDNTAGSCYVTGAQSIAIGEGIYKVVNKNSGLALDTYAAQTTNGGVVEQWAYSGTANDQWLLSGGDNGVYQVSNKNSGLLLDVNSGSGAVDQWGSTGTSNQSWFIMPNLDGTYSIVNQMTGTLLQVQGQSTANGARLGLLSGLTLGQTPPSNAEWTLGAP